MAKVRCRNIKNECPEPSCDTPVLLPGRCCKTCPGDVNSKSTIYCPARRFMGRPKGTTRHNLCYGITKEHRDNSSQQSNLDGELDRINDLAPARLCVFN